MSMKRRNRLEAVVFVTRGEKNGTTLKSIVDLSNKKRKEGRLVNFCFIDDGWYNNIIKDGQEIESQECWRGKRKRKKCAFHGRSVISRVPLDSHRSPCRIDALHCEELYK